MSEEINVQWFPGHMAKARRMIAENVSMVDAVCEIIDARIAYSSRNPELDALTGGKPRLIVLNRADQADPSVTRLWADYFRARGEKFIETDAKSGKGASGIKGAVRTLLRDRIEYLRSKGQSGKCMRVMVLGIPNVGKSSLINRVAGRKAAEASDRPGVTRNKQWINLGDGVEMLDTPGLLWPKLEDRTVGEHLAFTGAVRDDILDTHTLAAHLFEYLMLHYRSAVIGRYKLAEDISGNGYEMLAAAAKKRGFLLPGGELDTERMAISFLDEFRGGKLGRISLETPENIKR